MCLHSRSIACKLIAKGFFFNLILPKILGVLSSPMGNGKRYFGYTTSSKQETYGLCRSVPVTSQAIYHQREHVNQAGFMATLYSFLHFFIEQVPLKFF